MRHGSAVMMAMAMCALTAPSAASSGVVHVPTNHTPRRADERMHSPPLRSGRAGLNAYDLTRLSRKNARRKRRR